MLSRHLCIFSSLKKSRVFGRLAGYILKKELTLSLFVIVLCRLIVYSTFVCIIALIMLCSWGEYCLGNGPVFPDLIFAANACCVFA